MKTEVESQAIGPVRQESAQTGAEPVAASSADDLLQVVRARPGIHFRALAGAAGQRSSGALRTHLDQLLNAGAVIEVPDGRFKRFFVVGGHDPNLSPNIVRLSREVPRTIGKLLLVQPLNRTQLRRLVGCADSTLGYHLTRMVQVGDVERTGTRTGGHYQLRDEPRMRQVLTQMSLHADPDQSSNLISQPGAQQRLSRPAPSREPLDANQNAATFI